MTLLTFGASAIAFGAAAQNRQLSPPSASTPVSPQTQVAHGEDAEFLLDALRGSKAEVQMGELAQQRSKNAAVQQFGQKLQADHAKAAGEIETLLEPLNMSVPAGPEHRGTEPPRRACEAIGRGVRSGVRAADGCGAPRGDREVRGADSRESEQTGLGSRNEAVAGAAGAPRNSRNRCRSNC